MNGLQAPVAAASRPALWQPGEAIWTIVLNVVGLLVVLLGWLGVSGTARLSHQFGWTSVAVIGFAVAALGNALWLLAGRRAVGARCRVLLTGRSGTGLETVRVASAATMPSLTSNGSITGLVIGAGMTRYHRPSCMLVRGKDVTAYTRGRRPVASPCGICGP